MGSRCGCVLFLACFCLSLSGVVYWGQRDQRTAAGPSMSGLYSAAQGVCSRMVWYLACVAGCVADAKLCL